MLKLTLEIAVLAALIYAWLYASCNVAYGSNIDDKIWWDHSKIAIAYGGIGGENEPIDGYKLLRLAGVTAIVGGLPSDNMIQRAAAEGIKLIGLGYAWGIPHAIPSCRNAVNEKGQISTTACPFSEPFWEVTIRQPVLEAAKRSLEFKNVVGFFVDSEQYAVYPNINVCYCDDCWGRFIEYKNLEYPEVDISERVKWLESYSPDLSGDYIKYVTERFTEQYRKLAEEVHALNPLFVFGKLPESPNYWYDIGMALGTATDKAPFFVLLEGTYACSPGYGSKPDRSGWEPGYNELRQELDRLNIPYRILGGIWLTVDSKEKADKRYTRDVFQLYDQAFRLGSHPASNGYWFGPVGQIISRDYFRQHYPGSDIREYWLALRSVNRLLGITSPDDEKSALQFLRQIDD